MNPGLKTLARTLVVATNPIPPFNRINRMPYAAALRQVTRLVARCPEVASLYLRHGLTRSDWEPGLSDIDLTVVLRAGLESREEFAFLHWIAEAYARLRRRFPMLGELDILIEPCCSAWTRCGQRGAEAGDWSLLCGRETIVPAYANSATGVLKDRLDYACLTYESFLLRRCLAPTAGGWIESRALRRIAAKALRHADDGSGGGVGGRARGSEGSTGLLLRVLERLDARVRAVLPALTAGRPVVPVTPNPPEAAPRPGYNAGRYKALMDLESVIQSVTLSFAAGFIVLRDGLAAGALQEALAHIREIAPAENLYPLITTPTLLHYYLGVYRPRQYLEYGAHRHVLIGDDLVAGIAPPALQYLASELLAQSLNCVLAPARLVIGAFTSGAGSDWTVDAWRAAGLLLYLETGAIGTHARTVEACRQHEPELCAEIEKLAAERVADGRSDLRGYDLLRRLALAVNGRIEGIDPLRMPEPRILDASAGVAEDGR